MRHLFIVNPAAGRRNMTKDINAMVAHMLKDEDTEIHITKGPGDATEIARRSATKEGPVRLYACGGDGTANEVLSGMYGNANAELALFPVGSGNDFVKMFNPTADLARIVHAKPDEVGTIDIMECNGRLALNVVSAGFDAEIAADMQKFKKIPLLGGHMAYNMSLLLNFFSPLGCQFGFRIDGEEIPQGRYLFGVVSNGRYYGGGYMPAPHASLSDGFLDFLRVEVIPRSRFLRLIGDYKAGTHLVHTDFIHHRLCRAVQFLCDKPLNVTLDGEMAVMENPCVRILPSAIRAVMPK